MDEESKSSNIINFPVENKRFDLTNIDVMPDEIAEKIRLIKMTYFSDIADAILDNVIKSISILNLNDDPDAGMATSTDVIILKEAIIALMCRLVEMDHPLHQIGIDNIVISAYENENENTYFKYEFKKQEKKE